jgi:hypothetical protein
MQQTVHRVLKDVMRIWEGSGCKSRDSDIIWNFSSDVRVDDDRKS